MEQSQTDEMIQELLKRGLSGEPTPFELITNLYAKRLVKDFKKSVAKVVKMFENLRHQAILKYTLQIKEGTQDLSLLLAGIQFTKCIEFYTNELKTAKSMLQEYRVYIRSGHFLDAILGLQRKEYDMIDYRTLPWF